MPEGFATKVLREKLPFIISISFEIVIAFVKTILFVASMFLFYKEWSVTTQSYVVDTITLMVILNLVLQTIWRVMLFDHAHVVLSIIASVIIMVINMIILGLLYVNGFIHSFGIYMVLSLLNLAYLVMSSIVYHNRKRMSVGYTTTTGMEPNGNTQYPIPEEQDYEL